jgi:hypothetical protein
MNNSSTIKWCHYGKNRRRRAAFLCRELPHGKEDSRTHGNDKLHGKQLEKRTAKKIFTAKSAVTHGNDTAHGKEKKERTTKKKRRQRHSKPHGKETMHGKGPGRCRGGPFAVRPDKVHGKGSFAVRFFLCRAP